MKRISNLLFSLCLLSFLCAVTLGTFRNRDREVSFYENRTLAKVPEITEEGLISGDYFDRWESWFTDHAVARTSLMKANTWLELSLLRQPVVNDLVVTEDCLLNYHGFGRWDPGFDKACSTWASDLADFQSYVEEKGGVFCFVGVPHQYSYFSDKYPDYMDNRLWYLEPFREETRRAADEAGVNMLDMNAVFTAQGHPDSYYAASDHHYSYAGARATYNALIEHLDQDYDLGLKAVPVELQQVPNPFLGSRNRKLNGMWQGEDALSIGILKEEVPFRRWDNGWETEAFLYRLPGDKESYVTYEVYMGGDVAETILRTDRPELPNVLIFGDSFTNALETMLYASFNETRSIDLRYYSEKTIREYIDEYRPDVVICLRDESVYLSTQGNGNLS